MHTVNRVRNRGLRSIPPTNKQFTIARPNQLRVNIRRCMKYKALIQLAFVGTVAVLFCSCEEMPQQLQNSLSAVMPTPTPMPGWWDDSGAKGEPRIVVHMA